MTLLSSLRILPFFLFLSLESICLAQQRVRGTPQPAIRYGGRDCYLKMSPQVVPCNHFIITSSVDEYNFHFDNEDESMGIMFLIPKELTRNDVYPVTAVAFRQNTSITSFNGTGVCQKTSDNVKCDFLFASGEKIEASMRIYYSF
ncbi:hypothetical protein [Synechococcus sp. PCC 6312]|uniref:hypothetical protein n=1 Tax=Synechococcus sp. (strain ATCC 27167 / PCC 6312) TaxID=195253 RepID=UPI00029F067D|nr:hypothetical protein [Synechococcus sp. PCC 6312]AFY62789.1 hypothetical protein Syn6312_3779 [Synechococcus sp. PCC 6312]